VDFREPVQAVIPGAQGRILAVLSQTSAELNLRTIARLSGVSVAHASRVMPVLVELGLVRRREAPPSALFEFVPAHVAARAVTALVDVRRTVLEDLRASARRLPVIPASGIGFGSFARGEADRSSDVDILLVRSLAGEEDDAEWHVAVDEWAQWVRQLTGNPVELLECGLDEVSVKLRSKKQLWSDIRRDGVVVHGLTISELRERRSA
jgi:predicted nucleotidyltransferase